MASALGGPCLSVSSVFASPSRSSTLSKGGGSPSPSTSRGERGLLRRVVQGGGGARCAPLAGPCGSVATRLRGPAGSPRGVCSSGPGRGLIPTRRGQEAPEIAVRGAAGDGPSERRPLHRPGPGPGPLCGATVSAVGGAGGTSGLREGARHVGGGLSEQKGNVLW